MATKKVTKKKVTKRVKGKLDTKALNQSAGSMPATGMGSVPLGGPTTSKGKIRKR